MKPFSTIQILLLPLFVLGSLSYCGCTADQTRSGNMGTRPVMPNNASSPIHDGSVRATFDGNGHVASVVITKSVGSKILDENTLAYAKKNWTGPPYSTQIVPIYYK